MTTLKDNDPWDIFKEEYNRGYLVGFFSGIVVSIVMYFILRWIS